VSDHDLVGADSTRATVAAGPAPGAAGPIRRLRAVAWAASLVALAAYLFLGGGLSALRSLVPSQMPAPEAGRPAPDFEALTVDGERVRLSDLRGKAVLLNFWATWCAPCRLEMPEIQAAYDEYRDRGLVVVAIDVAEDAEAVQPFLRELGLTFPAVLDPKTELALTYRVTGLPTSFFIGRDGVIRDVHLGPMLGPTLRAKLEQVL
jgi:peroxiredoxin